MNFVMDLDVLSTREEFPKALRQEPDWVGRLNRRRMKLSSHAHIQQMLRFSLERQSFGLASRVKGFEF